MAASKKTGSKRGPAKAGSTTKRSTAKAGAKASSAKSSSRAARSKVNLSAGKLQVTLNASDAARAEKCLRETGKITLGLREVQVTRLRDLVDAEVIVN